MKVVTVTNKLPKEVLILCLDGKCCSVLCLPNLFYFFIDCRASLFKHRIESSNTCICSNVLRRVVPNGTRSTYYINHFFFKFQVFGSINKRRLSWEYEEIGRESSPPIFKRRIQEINWIF